METIVSKQSREEGRHRSFNAQYAIACVHGCKPGYNELLDFVRDKPAFRTDNERYWPVYVAGALCRSIRVSDERECSLDETGKFIFDKRLEQRPERNLGENRVLGLLKAQNQLLLNGIRKKKRTLPVAFFNAKTIQQNNPLHSQRT